MKETKGRIHPAIPEIKDDLDKGKITRRDFLKRGLKYGGTAVFVVPVINVLSMATAGATTGGSNYGNGLDVNEIEMLHYFAEDPDTKIIAAYIEGVKDGKEFSDALRSAAERSPW